jgi:hypothetical protein
MVEPVKRLNLFFSNSSTSRAVVGLIKSPRERDPSPSYSRRNSVRDFNNENAYRITLSDTLDKECGQVIKEAITSGTPLYNNGDAEGEYTILNCFILDAFVVILLISISFPI